MAIVFGFLIIACLIIILVFAVKTRKQINAYGKGNILWRREKPVEDPNAPPDIEDWVNEVLIIQACFAKKTILFRFFFFNQRTEKVSLFCYLNNHR